MIRVILYVALVFLVAAGFAWLADRPGEVALNWQGYEFQTSLLVAAIGFAAVLVVLALAWTLLRAIVRAPKALGNHLDARRRDRGHRALSSGIIAVGAGDTRAAVRAADEARTYLGDQPLPLLLSAQAAQLAGNGTGARSAFELLARGPETRVLGLHGLFVEARRRGDDEAARHFAEQAAEAAPKIGWAGTALFEYQALAGDWLGAMRTLSANQNARLIDKAEAKRLRGVLLTARAMELEAGDPVEARAAALEAQRLVPSLTPAAVVAARLLSRTGEYRRAAKALEQAWRVMPHPDIAEGYANVRSGDSVRDRLKRMRHLAAIRINHPECAMALARAAIDAREWDEARTALAGLVESGPSERVCLLMAEIEEREHGDRGRVRMWLTHAITAPRDPTWAADGHVFDEWAPVSPVSGRVGAFEWIVVAGAAPPREALEIQADLEAEAIAAPTAPATPLIAADAPGIVTPEPEAEAVEAADTAAVMSSAAEPEEAEAAEAAPETKPSEALPAEAAPTEEKSEPKVGNDPPAKAGPATETGAGDDGSELETRPVGDAEEAEETADDAGTGKTAPPSPDDPGPEPEEDTENQPRRRFGIYLAAGGKSAWRRPPEERQPQFRP